MIDQLFDREYQAGRKDFHDGIDRLVQRVSGATSQTFRSIHRVQFAAPWAKKEARC